jgi:transcriptional regulator with XRE-family HTH domain
MESLAPRFGVGLFSSGGASWCALLAARLNFPDDRLTSGRSVELMSDRLPNAIDRHVASRLRLRRLEAGLTQTMLADALGISFQQLQKYEGVQSHIRRRAVSAFADARRAGAVLFRWYEQARQEARKALIRRAPALLSFAALRVGLGEPPAEARCACACMRVRMAWSEDSTPADQGCYCGRPPSGPPPSFTRLTGVRTRDPEAVLAREPETCHPLHSSRRDVGATPGHR